MTIRWFPFVYQRLNTFTVLWNVLSKTMQIRPVHHGSTELKLFLDLNPHAQITANSNIKCFVSHGFW